MFFVLLEEDGKMARYQPRGTLGLNQYACFLCFSILFLEKSILMSFMAYFVINQGRGKYRVMKERHERLSWKKISSLVGLCLLGRTSSARAVAEPTALNEVLTMTGKRHQFPFEKHSETRTASCRQEL